MFGVGSTMMHPPSSNTNSEFMNFSWEYMLVFALVCVTFCIVQAADANRLVKKFNNNLDKEGTLLWY